MHCIICIWWLCILLYIRVSVIFEVVVNLRTLFYRFYRDELKKKTSFLTLAENMIVLKMGDAPGYIFLKVLIFLLQFEPDQI
jgi:hypothetical protein